MARPGKAKRPTAKKTAGHEERRFRETRRSQVNGHPLRLKRRVVVYVPQTEAGSGKPQNQIKPGESN